MVVINVLILIFILPAIQEFIHYLMLVGIRVSVSKFHVDYGVSLAFP